MNRLADQTSPYLRQHRDNPVDWYPWGPEAFARATELDRPLFISIGYSACHWCHVMAHESFENDATAAIVNDHFVAIKVDREERPDVDALYMDAVQALTGQGGWPLTIFATPGGQPFFGGTYFPPQSRPGMPSFAELCQAVEDAWSTRRSDLVEHAKELSASIAQRLGPPPGATSSTSAVNLLDRAMERFTAVYDPQYGGVGRSPKFPQVPILELALIAADRGNPKTLAMVSETLLAMASGGIYDQIGGGFARYSVDREWLVPHFEKMLYDQAGIIRLLLHTWQLTGDARFRQILDETVTYVLRDLRFSTGGIASAEDADSDGGEGRFYTWTAQELLDVLGPIDGERALQYYGVSGEGNFEDGRTILFRPERGELIRSEIFESIRARLFAARSTRVRPSMDDKVLTEWNAMMISALAEAAAVTRNPAWRAAAIEIAQFCLTSLRREDGRWLRSFAGGRAAHLGVATDYAWLVDAFTRLAELTGERTWIDEATMTADALIELFGADDGGFYVTGADGESLVVRPRDTYDGVTPAAGSIAALGLARLGALTGEDRWTARARKCVDAAGEGLQTTSMAFPTLVGAALLLEEGAIEVVVVGERPDLVHEAQTTYLPAAVCCWGERTASPLWEDRVDGTAYVCRGGTCLAPVTTREDLRDALQHARLTTQ